MKVTLQNSLLYYSPQIKPLVDRVKDIDLDEIDPSALKEYEKIFDLIVFDKTIKLWKGWEQNPTNDIYASKIFEVLSQGKLFEERPGPVTLVAQIIVAKLTGKLPLFVDQMTKQYQFYNFVLTNLFQVRHLENAAGFLKDGVILAYSLWDKFLAGTTTFRMIENQISQKVASDILRNLRILVPTARASLVKVILEIFDEEKEVSSIKKFVKKTPINVLVGEIQTFSTTIKQDKKTKLEYEKKFESYLQSFNTGEMVDLTEEDVPVQIRDQDPNRNELPAQQVKESKQEVSQDKNSQKEKLDIDQNLEESDNDEEGEDLGDEDDDSLLKEELEEIKDSTDNVQVTKEEAKAVKKFYIGPQQKKFFKKQYIDIVNQEQNVAAFRVNDDIVIYETLIKGKDAQEKEAIFEKYSQSYESLSGFELFLEFCAYLGSTVFEEKQREESLALGRYIDSPDVYYNKENKRELVNLLSKYWRRFLTKEKIYDLWRDLQEFKNQYVLLVQFGKVFNRISSSLEESQVEFLAKRAEDLDAGYLGYLLLSKLVISVLDTSTENEIRKQMGAIKGNFESDIFFFDPQAPLENKYTLDNLFSSFKKYAKNLGNIYIPSEIEIILEQSYEKTTKELDNEPAYKDYHNIKLPKKQEVQQTGFVVEQFIISLVQKSSTIGKQYELRIKAAEEEKLDKVPIPQLTYGNKKFLDLFWTNVNYIDTNVTLDTVLNVFPEEGKPLDDMMDRLSDIKKDLDYNSKEEESKYPTIDVAYSIPMGWREKFDQQQIDFNTLQSQFKKEKNKPKQYDDEEEEVPNLDPLIKNILYKERNEYILAKIMSEGLDELKNYISDRYREEKSNQQIETLIREASFKINQYIKQKDFDVLKKKLEKAFDENKPNSSKPFLQISYHDFPNSFFFDPSDAIMFLAYERIVKVLLNAEVDRLKSLGKKAKKKAEKETLKSSTFLNKCSTDEQEVAKKVYLKDLKTYYFEKYRYPSDVKLYLYLTPSKYQELSKQKKPVNPCPENLIPQSPRVSPQRENAQQQEQEEEPLERRRPTSKSPILGRSPSRSPLIPKSPALPKSPVLENIVSSREGSPKPRILKDVEAEEEIIQSSPELQNQILGTESTVEIFKLEEERLLDAAQTLLRDSKQLQSLGDDLQSQVLKAISNRTSSNARTLLDYIEAIRKSINRQKQ